MGTSEQSPMCSLTENGVDLQLRAWHELHEDSISTELIPDGAAMTLAPELEGKVAELVAIESECCPSLTFVSRRVDGLIRLEVTSTHPEAAPLIASVLGVSHS
jgi:hypothetical protein